MIAYKYERLISYTFDEAIAKVTEELGKQGFGILTTIDVAQTLKKKIDIDYPPYVILGACNPRYAHRALEADPSVGNFLPCSVVVRQAKGGVMVEFLDPVTVMKLVENDEVNAVATEVRGKLQTVLEAL